MLEEILRESSARHKHLCPRQVLGARMGLFAGELLDLDLPRADKRLLVIAETDGCFVDGLIASTGCHVGGRTLRIHDFGKVAATFVDVQTEVSLRIIPWREARSLAANYAPECCNNWEAMLFGYQVMPASELFTVQQVRLDPPLEQIISAPKRKAICEICGEEIINGREIVEHCAVLCRACAGEGYYHCSVDLLCGGITCSYSELMTKPFRDT
jgi:formylmethanofuran dehydrogenase subunit E